VLNSLPAPRCREEAGGRFGITIKGGTDPNAERFQKLNDLAVNAQYNREMVALYPAATARNANDPSEKNSPMKASPPWLNMTMTPADCRPPCAS